MEIKKFWRELIILILFVVLAYVLGRGYESKIVEGLILENQRLNTMKLNTETVISQNAPIETQRIFQQLGYDIIIAQQ